MEGYTKVVDDCISISLSYLKAQDQSKSECIVTFSNISDTDVKVNPQPSDLDKPSQSDGWFSNIFGGQEAKHQPLSDIDGGEDSQGIIRLGYIQLFGYVLTNYALSSDASTASLDSKSGEVPWFMNNDYQSFYHSNDDINENELNEVPFIVNNSKEKLIIGGKVGGINDLSVEKGKSGRYQAPFENHHLIHDLLYPFNSSKTPTKVQNIGSGDQEISLEEIADSIIPIYTTSQSLLFTNLSLASETSKSFHVVFPKIANMPPSYNSNSTGLACDQGLISIRYALVIGMNLAFNSRQMAVYFPYTIKGERKRANESEYSVIPKIDKNWDVTISQDDRLKVEEERLSESVETKEAFLEDLSQLIKNDLQHMPKVSKNERRESVNGALTERARRNSEKSANTSKSFYKVNVNSSELCTINVMRNVFHPGDDINFCIDVSCKQSDAIVGGISVFLETDEIYPKVTEGGKAKQKSHSFKVSPSKKMNVLASSLGGCSSAETVSKHQVQGYINIPVHLSSQFTVKELLTLKHFLVFKFTLINYNSIKFDPNSTKESNEAPHPTDSRTNEEAAASDTNEEQDAPDNLSPPLSNVSLADDHDIFSFTKSMKYGLSGSDMKFRLPLTVVA